MNWKLCVTDPQRRALKLCYGSMDDGCGSGYGNGFGFGNGDGCGAGFGNGAGDGAGGGSFGYDINGVRGGDGWSPKEWK